MRQNSHDTNHRENKMTEQSNPNSKSGRILMSLDGTFYEIAKQHAKAAAASGDGQRVIQAVIFSVIAVEALLNQFIDSASMNASREMKTALSMLDEKGSPMEKLERFPLLVGGAPWDKGSAPYQDFNALVGLRNALVHYRRGKRIEKLAHQLDVHNLGASPEQLSQLAQWYNVPIEEIPWPQRYLTPKTARWAVETARNMVGKLYELVDEVSKGAVNNQRHAQRIHERVKSEHSEDKELVVWTETMAAVLEAGIDRQRAGALVGPNPLTGFLITSWHEEYDEQA